MSPPQVNLARKQPPAVVDEEVPASQKLEENNKLPDISLNIGDANVSYTGFRSRIGLNFGHANVSRQRRRRIICCTVMMTVVVLAVLAAIPLAMKWRSRHRNHWSCRYGKDKIGENVWVDHKQHLINAKHGHGNSQEPSIHALHEYGRRMAAYKDVDKNICYITRLDETFEEGYTRWEAYEENDSRDAKTLRVLTDKHIEAIVVRHIADIHIEAHCSNAESFWAVEIDEKEITQEMMIIHV